jgi:hypothetical protein
MKGLLQFSYVVLLVLFSATEILAQVVPPGGGPNDGAPIDGFSGLLIALSVGYGAYRMKKGEDR